MKRITLVCCAGMSTSLLVTKMQEVATKNNLPVSIIAVSQAKFSQYEDETDILLLGPQVGFLLEEFKEKYEPKGIVVRIIDSTDYGMLNGAKVLKAALTK